MGFADPCFIGREVIFISLQLYLFAVEPVAFKCQGNLVLSTELVIVKGSQADVSSVSPLSERMGIGLIRFNERLTLGTSALKLYMVINLRCELS